MIEVRINKFKGFVLSFYDISYAGMRGPVCTKSMCEQQDVFIEDSIPLPFKGDPVRQGITLVALMRKPIKEISLLSLAFAMSKSGQDDLVLMYQRCIGSEHHIRQTFRRFYKGYF